MRVGWGLARVVIEKVVPEVDGGLFPIKRIVGDQVTVEADIFADGHDALAAVLLYQHDSDDDCATVPMKSLGNDRWQGTFTVTKLGRYKYSLRGWVGNRRFATTYKWLSVTVDRERAGFSAWYEMFPRSTSTEPGKHGTLRGCIATLPYVAAMGFDVLYLPPIHPIGHAYRKGRNNEVTAAPSDPGSPWAIGNKDGGHDAIHPQLGTLEDFRALVAAARDQGLEIALDMALHCSADHPYVEAHPEWFKHRADGSIQYAENPPKKYQDIYPFDFASKQWKSLWEELKRIFLFWIDQGVRIFRVDNPHTKPFAFWQWVIAEVKRDFPEVIFLSEAFTRPKPMKYLAKLGFTQSYTYFAWRNTKEELTAYFTELTQTETREFFRPNLWPNTPDILTDYLQKGGRPAFVSRFILAATLGANYGIYGPAFELIERQPREPHSEEYLHSEKYEIKIWNREAAYSLAPLIARVNAIRHAHPALHRDASLRFHEVDNPHLICYSKQDSSADNAILIIVNLEIHYTHSGWVTFSEGDLSWFGLTSQSVYDVEDLLQDARYTWQGRRNYVELNPRALPAHIFLIKRQSERFMLHR